jgi:hypothetical protein
VRFYISIFGLVFLLVLPAAWVAAAFTLEDVSAAAKALRQRARVVHFGNSVNRAFSRCDSDRRSLTALFSALAERDIVDISRGGLRLSKFIDMAFVLQWVRRSEVVVIPLQGWDLYRTASQSRVASIKRYLRSPMALSTLLASHPPPVSPVEYEGRYYGDYDQLRRTYFEVEKRNAQCPEVAGYNKEFVRFMYWRSYGQPLSVAEGLAELVAMSREFEEHGTRVLIYVPPVDVALMRRLDAEVYRVWKAKMTDGLSALSNAGIRVLDLSELLPESDFADPWCACGHMSIKGRYLVAQELALAVKKQD